MDDVPTPPIPGAPVEAALSRGLAAGDAMLGSVPGVLRHLLVHDDSALFTESLLARTRAMMADLAAQIAGAIAGASPAAPAGTEQDTAAIEAALIATPGLLAHLHATAIEWQVTEALQQRIGIDPVLSPLVQALIASPDGDVGAAAMTMLAAQARFAQAQRRMRLPLGELPPDLVHAALAAIAPLDGEGRGSATIRAQYDERATRLGLLARLVTCMGAGAIAALSLGHGGLALFATTMAIACDLPRDVCLLATQEGQATRLALALRAAGLKASVIEEVLLALHPDARGLFGIAEVSPERAAGLLAASPLAGLAAG
ncbi:MAG: hypothetical protein KGM17_04170 [Sphingomonadales bacterium]|nr:hypothetical protein [Sphingomonadales bacterium]